MCVADEHWCTCSSEKTDVTETGDMSRYSIYGYVETMTTRRGGDERERERERERGREREKERDIERERGASEKENDWERERGQRDKGRKMVRPTKRWREIYRLHYSCENHSTLWGN